MQPASRRAREVVGWYGDPDSTWGIGIDSRWADPIDVEALPARLRRLIESHPDLGTLPEIERVAVADWDRARSGVLEPAWDQDTSMIRVVVAEDGTRLCVAAHHGALDGLGTVAAVGALAGREITPEARGLPPSSGPRPSFLGAALGRLWEAIVSPPPRFGGHGSTTPGEYQRELIVASIPLSSPRLAAAIAAAYRAWPGSARSAIPLVMLGVSRRTPGAIHLDRQTGYVRFRVDPDLPFDQVRAAFNALTVEPDFPETSVGGLAPRLVRPFRSRLGATAQASNLGVLHAHGMDSISLFPALSGPNAVAVGVASTPTATTLTVRTRRSDFSAAEADALLASIGGRAQDLARTAQ